MFGPALLFRRSITKLGSRKFFASGGAALPNGRKLLFGEATGILLLRVDKVKIKLSLVLTVEHGYPEHGRFPRNK